MYTTRGVRTSVEVSNEIYSLNDVGGESTCGQEMRGLETKIECNRYIRT